MSSVAFVVSTTGPLFQPEALTVPLEIAEGAVAVLSELAMNRLTSAFPTGVPVKTGNYWRHIHQTVQGPMAQIDDSAVIYGPWLEGVSSRNTSTRFKGYSTFRRAAQWLTDEQLPIVAQKGAEALAKELGG